MRDENLREAGCLGVDAGGCEARHGQDMGVGDAEVAWQVESLAKRLKLKLYRTCVSENLNVDKVSEQ